MKKILFTTSVLSLVLTACAHGVMRGSVAMKTADNEAHVCMDKDEVKPGDKVRLFTNRCTPKGGRGDPRSCEKINLGNGVVKENLNEHYSLVVFDKGVPLEEGSFVETY